MTLSSVSTLNSTLPESGTITPTASNEDQPKGKSSFLGFVPFTDFLRVRYPSHSSERTIQKGNVTSPGDMSEDAENNEEERSSIHSIGMACKELGVVGPALEGAIEA